MAHPVRKKPREVGVGHPSAGQSSALSSRNQAATKLASMIEEHMADLRLSEQEKNRRVARFSERVDLAIAKRAKS